MIFKKFLKNLANFSSIAVFSCPAPNLFHVSKVPLQYKDDNYDHILAFTGPESGSTILRFGILEQKLPTNQKFQFSKKQFSYFY